jgi:2,3-bisphosphoglycerate-dependent phosphoglycerate mutase
VSADTVLYLLRHALPTRGDMPNRQRPLSDAGQGQARGLVEQLLRLQIDAVCTSPYLRARQTVEPFCQQAGMLAIIHEDLGESGADEELEQVCQRMARALDRIAAAHAGQRLLVCTHGGCMWGALKRFCPDFGHQQYRAIGCPELRRICYTGAVPRLDLEFTLQLERP